MKILLTFSLLILMAVAEHRSKVAFTAYFSDMGDVDIGTTNPIAFSKVTVNAGNGYDTRTGIFTAPVSGIYLFILSAKASFDAAGTIRLGIYKSGTLVTATDLLPRGVAFMDQTSTFATLQVWARETVDVRHLSGPTVIDKWYETSFTGVLLYAD